jgi:hypothetical protein
MQLSLRKRQSVRRRRHHRGMWQVAVVCSACEEENEVVVEELDDADREACPCGYSYIVLSVASFEPVELRRGELVHLHKRPSLDKAA